MGFFNKISKEHIFQESDSFTCGPCCLAMVYVLRKKKITLKQILKDFHHPEKGKPTYVHQLARHLNKNGVKTKVLISTSKAISPAWSGLPKEEVIENLKDWLTLHPKNAWFMDVLHMIFYLQEGGEIQQCSYTAKTIKDMLDHGSIVILCVDEDWMWGHRFTLVGDKRIVNDIEGAMEGHFVLVTGYKDDEFHVLDPFPTNLESRHGEYDINQDQVVNASLTWDAEIIEVFV